MHRCITQIRLILAFFKKFHVNVHIVKSNGRRVGVQLQDIANGAVGSGFFSRAGQIRHNLATGRHRSDASSEPGCPGTKSRRWPRLSSHASE